MVRDSKKLDNSSDLPVEVKLDEKNTEKIYKEYYDRKQVALTLEKMNNSRIIVFPSVASKGDKDEWFKIAGNSVYFYKYYVAPRLKRRKPPTVHPDTDMRCRSRNGVIFLHWKENILKTMEGLGYEMKEESGVMIFELDYKFSFDEIKALKKREKEDLEALNDLFRPKKVFPDLYGIILELSKTIPVKAKRLKDGFREDFAPELNCGMIRLMKAYYRFANGRMKQEEAKDEMLMAIDDLEAVLRLLSENGCLDVTGQIRIGKLLADMKVGIERHFSEK